MFMQLSLGSHGSKCYSFKPASTMHLIRELRHKNRESMVLDTPKGARMAITSKLCRPELSAQ